MASDGPSMSGSAPDSSATELTSLGGDCSLGGVANSAEDKVKAADRFLSYLCFVPDEPPRVMMNLLMKSRSFLIAGVLQTT